MTSNEAHSSVPDSGNEPHVSPDLLTAFTHSNYDLDRYYDELKQHEGKPLLALAALAEKRRREGEFSADYKAGFFDAAIILFILQDMHKESAALEADLSLTAYTDADHTSVEPS